MAKLNVNQGIKAREVRVIDGAGEQLGILPTREAIKKAEEAGLDLVEVAPTSNPPVCRIMDYGKYKYEQNKKTHSAKLSAKTSQLKEIKLRPFTDTHDLEVKIRHSEGFLDHGHKVKVVLTFRGRENVNTSIGRALMNQFMEKISVHGTIEQLPKMEGNSLVMIVVPKSEKSGAPKKAKQTTQKPPASPASAGTVTSAASSPQALPAGSPEEKKKEPAN